MYIIFKGSSLNIVLVAKTGDQVQPLHYWIGRNQNRQPTSLNTFLPYDESSRARPLIYHPIPMIQSVQVHFEVFSFLNVFGP